MGKPKNKGKSQPAEEDSDTETMDKQNNAEVLSEKPTGKHSKKEKRKKKDDDWEDDVASELASMSLDANKGFKETNNVEEEEEAPAPVVNKKEKKKKKKQKEEREEEDEEEEEDVSIQRSNKKMAAFNMLMMEDDDDENDKGKSESDNEKEEVKQEIRETSKQQKKKDKKKKDKKEKGKTAEEEDLDALLAEIDKPKEKTSKKKKGKKAEADEKEETDDKAGDEATEAETKREKVEPKVVTMEDMDDEEDDRKKKRKKKGKEKEAKEAEEGEDKAEEGGEGDEEEAGTVKTAAQKRKEKKEREKKKLAEKKKQAAMKKDTAKGEGEKDGEMQGKAEEASAGKDADAEKKASDDEGDGEEDGKKKKKDKKKKGEKEEKVKKPSARVKMMQEMLRKQKEEEERLRKEEEERIRKEEEAIAAAIEKKKQEELKKQQKKERQRLKREQLKAEGLLLTAAQKQERKRAQQMLEMMRAQGIELPDKEEIKKKRPVYEHKKKKQQQKKEGTPGTEESPSPTDTPASTPLTEDAPEGEKKAEEEVSSEQTMEAEAAEEEDDVKEEWDASSDEEEEEKESSPEAETKIEIVDKESSVEAKAEEEEEDDDDDVKEDEEESEEEDSGDDDDEESESESESESDEDLTPYERAEQRLKKYHEKCEANRTTDKLRAPVVCVLGHVDTGKTKILDKLRRTNVQDGEAGGITQQIGATNVPAQAILDKTTMCKEFQKKEMKLPGLLIIDTPGHESFSNLRSRGSSLCDIAILVIDIMHGLEPQTIESINLLKERKTPFVVALNKIDRLYQWKTNPNSDVMNTIKKQPQMAKQEFEERKNAVITQLAEQSLNAALFYENKNPKEYVSLVPTSAHTGDGMGNLLSLICELTQTWLAKKISYTEELQATVMEVKALPGLGTTIDVILVNGKLAEGEQIVLAGTEGPIVTQIRGLLMPQPMRELRVKSQYEHHKEVPAAQGVKIIGKDLEKALAGLPLYVAHDDDEVEYYKEELSEALKDVLGSIKLSERGVFVQASTLGSLEALLEFLRTSKIPYAGINIGPVHKRDIMKASIMLEHDPQWAVILAFDVKVERDAQEMADSLGVHIFTADIIYHLQDKFLKFREDLKKQKKDEFQHVAVFPCKLRVLPQHIFNKRDPIVMGVVVEAGVVRLGTPICVPSKEFVDLGRITSLEVNHKPLDKATRGQEVCIKIENIPGETPKLFGRHFDHTDMLISKISRNSIDAVKDYFRDEMTKQDWTLMVELKKLFQIL